MLKVVIVVSAVSLCVTSSEKKKIRVWQFFTRVVVRQLFPSVSLVCLSVSCLLVCQLFLLCSCISSLLVYQLFARVSALCSRISS